MKGYFLSIEGGDGSGKSTQIQNIVQYLETCGYEVIVTREPGGTKISEQIREILLHPEHTELTPHTEVLLYAASRAQHVEEKILPALQSGKIVLTDRFTDSSIAYQAYGRELGEIVATINKFATNRLQPDMTFFLDVTPEVAMARKKQQPAHVLDRMEQQQSSFHKRVSQGYDALCKQYPERICRIDATQSKEQVFAQIKQKLDCLIAKK